MKKWFPLFLFLISANLLFAQKGNPYQQVDDYVKKLGPLEAFNVAIIADTLTRQFTDKQQKARAIFYWTANNIALDPKAIKSNDNKKTDPVLVVQLRKATSLGFALLIQEMCSMAKIRCLTVDGYVKSSAEDINNKADEINHSWNVVQLGQSPEQWFYIDAAKASGYLDKKQTLFTPLFTSEYFFADRLLFNLDHYPDNHAWLLGDGPKSLGEFYALPIISSAAYSFGMQKPMPLNGYIKTKTTALTNFSFTCNNAGSLAAITLVMGDGNKQQKPVPMNFTNTGGLIKFSYTFKREDTFPIHILADGNEILQYTVEVVE
jgi:hypothetical protein